jgi:hypothetical protein
MGNPHNHIRVFRQMAETMGDEYHCFSFPGLAQALKELKLAPGIQCTGGLVNG